MTDPSAASLSRAETMDLFSSSVMHARRGLDDIGEFRPFAVFMNDAKQPELLQLDAADRKDVDPVQFYTEHLRRLVADRAVTATAICYMGWPVSDGDAIVVELESHDSPALHGSVEYEPGVLGPFNYSEPKFKLGENRIFPAAQ